MITPTAERILLAAEAEFAAHGFVETSVRTITAKAKVNLASVNYHFGSKKGLIQAVTDRFMGPVTELLHQRVEAYLQQPQQPQGEAAVGQLLDLLMACCLQVSRNQHHSLAVFARLIVLSYTQSQGHLRKHLMRQYGATFFLYMGAIRAQMPAMSNEQFFWRFHQLLGSMVFTLSSSEALIAICAKEYEHKRDLEQLLYDLVPVLAAASQAPLSTLNKEP